MLNPVLVSSTDTGFTSPRVMFGRYMVVSLEDQV